MVGHSETCCPRNFINPILTYPTHFLPTMTRIDFSNIHKASASAHKNKHKCRRFNVCVSLAQTRQRRLNEHEPRQGASEWPWWILVLVKGTNYVLCAINASERRSVHWLAQDKLIVVEWGGAVLWFWPTTLSMEPPRPSMWECVFGIRHVVPLRHSAHAHRPEYSLKIFANSPPLREHCAYFNHVRAKVHSYTHSHIVHMKTIVWTSHQSGSV